MVHGERGHCIREVVGAIFKNDLSVFSSKNSYYEYLSPLTPINPPDLRLVSTHANMIDEEPILTVTILTIASRYTNLEGPGGKTRSLMVHGRLWNYLRDMITRMFWGQEQFGGGFCGAGSRKAGQKGLEKSRLRCMGTIERYRNRQTDSLQSSLT